MSRTLHTRRVEPTYKYTISTCSHSRRSQLFYLFFFSCCILLQLKIYTHTLHNVAWTQAGRHTHTHTFTSHHQHSRRHRTTCTTCTQKIIIIIQMRKRHKRILLYYENHLRTKYRTTQIDLLTHKKKKKKMEVREMWREQKKIYIYSLIEHNRHCDRIETLRITTNARKRMKSTIEKNVFAFFHSNFDNYFLFFFCFVFSPFDEIVFSCWLLAMK